MKLSSLDELPEEWQEAVADYADRVYWLGYRDGRGDRLEGRKMLLMLPIRTAREMSPIDPLEWSDG
jgi:hypothetical protein